MSPWEEVGRSVEDRILGQRPERNVTKLNDLEDLGDGGDDMNGERWVRDETKCRADGE